MRSTLNLKHSNLWNYMEVEWSCSCYGRCGPSHLLDRNQSRPGRYDADGNRRLVFRLAVSKSTYRHFALIMANIKLCDDS
jgi:hypothetical protein